MRKKRLELFDILNILFLSLFGLIVFYPFYNTFIVSITTEYEYVKTPFMLFPKHPVFLSYQVLFTSPKMWHGFVITMFVVVVGVFYQLALTTTLAYSLNKKYPGLKFISLAIIFTMYFGGGLIPFYMLMVKLKLVNSLLSMVLPAGVGIGYMILLRDFFSKIPRELEESAFIEGANDIIVFWKIHLPLTIPMLVTIALYYGVDRWNDYYLAMMFIKDANKRPLQLMLMEVLTEYTKMANEKIPATFQKRIYSESMKMATIIFTALPIMCVYPFLQKYFIRGLMTGAVKA